MKNFLYLIGTAFCLYGLVLVFTPGCTTSQTTAAYKAEVGTDLGVKGAMTGWGFYVKAKHPGTNAETQVLHAFQSVQAAEIVVIEATRALASNPTNTAPLTAAEGALAATQGGLISLINTLTNSIH